MFVTRIRNLLAVLLAFAWIGIADGLSTNPVAIAQEQQAPAKEKGPDGDRKRLRDADPQVRLKAAVALSARPDEEAINVLIELLAVLPAPQRRQAELALQGIAEECSPNPALARDDEISRRILRDAWAGWWRNTDGPALMAAFQKRTLSREQTAKALSRIAELGHERFAIRQRAAAEIVALGLPVVPLLRQALPGTSLEQSRRIELCLEQIAKAHDSDGLPAVAARLLALRKPAGATETLLAYVAFTDDDVMKAEVTKALHRLAGASVAPDASLIKAIHDAFPVRRAIAGEVLGAVTDAKVRAAVRKLLADKDLSVRLRVAVALACGADRKAVPVLIDLLAKLPADQVWQAEEILRRVGGRAPPLGGADGCGRRDRAAQSSRRLADLVRDVRRQGQTCPTTPSAAVPGIHHHRGDVVTPPIAPKAASSKWTGTARCAGSSRAITRWTCGCCRTTACSSPSARAAASRNAISRATFTGK